MLLGAKAGNVIAYFKTEKDVSINLQEIGICKYKEMLIATVKDALEILGYDLNEMFGIDEDTNRKKRGGLFVNSAQA